MCCVFIFKRAKASERQRAMIGKTYHIQTCTWNDVCNVLCFYNQAGQSQWTPARDDWKNISHPDMHFKWRLRCIVFYMYFDQTTGNASERSVFKIAIWEHAFFDTPHGIWFAMISCTALWILLRFIQFWNMGDCEVLCFYIQHSDWHPYGWHKVLQKKRTMGQTYCEGHSFYSSLAKSIDCWEKKQY